MTFAIKHPAGFELGREVTSENIGVRLFADAAQPEDKYSLRHFYPSTQSSRKKLIGTY